MACVLRVDGPPSKLLPVTIAVKPLSRTAGEGAERSEAGEGRGGRLRHSPPIIAHMLNHARTLRHNATDAERRLWAALQHRRLQDYKFRRQHPIGRFVVDFACTKHHLVIEADGGQHDQSSADTQRTAWLESQGWRVMRFWNNDTLTNTEGVLTHDPGRR